MRFGDHPSVRLARWYWRVTQAAPDLPATSAFSDYLPGIDIPGRYDLAVVLAEAETDINTPQRLLDSVEKYLSYAPWRSDVGAIEYKVAVEQGRIPGLSRNDLISYEGVRRRETSGVSQEEEERLIGEIFESEVGPRVREIDREEDTNGQAKG